MDAYYLPGAAADDLENVQDTSSRKRKASGEVSTLKKSRVRWNVQFQMLMLYVFKWFYSIITL